MHETPSEVVRGRNEKNSNNNLIMNTEYDSELVERYFDNELSAVETRSVIERLQTDREFKALFDQEKALIRSIRAAGLQKDLLHLKEVEKNLQKSLGERRSRLSGIQPWYYAIAAAIALFVVATIWFIPGRETPEELFQSYFVPVGNVFEATTRGSVEATERSAAFQAYDQGNYQVAAEVFNTLLSQEKEPAVLLLNANANLALGNAGTARENLIILIRDFDDFDMAAKWYLGLCYLKEGDIEQARSVLEELGGAEVFYTSKAKELLKKVK
jgi:tetratricopeptide (TPR) repeat protein